MSDDEDVEVEISGTVLVHKVVRMRRADAERINALSGFALRNAVESDVFFEREDMVEVEDIATFKISEVAVADAEPKVDEVLNCLKQAKREISLLGWTQGEYARDANDNMVESRSDRAATLCIIGAISRVERCSPEDLTETALEAINRLETVTGTHCSIDTWNDRQGRSIEEVFSAFDAAIEGKTYVSDDDDDEDEEEPF